jgi:manganese transport protein
MTNQHGEGGDEAQLWSPDAADALPGERRVLEAAQRSLQGHRRGIRGLWPFLGPAFIAAVAYVDPGNFATNIAAGSEFGYMLLWVILASNLMAMLIQAMSAKLGIATGKNLAEVSRDRFSRPVRIGMWAQAEFIAMATDLAEFIGAALALNLLFDIPLLSAAVITGVISFGILELQRRGFRHLEAAIAGMVGLIVAGFAFQVFLAEPDATDLLHGLLTPQFAGTDSVLLAVGILGATVMPHVIYLHSALTQQRVVGNDAAERRAIYRFELVDVVIAMTIAGVINMSMLVMAAAAFHSRGMTGVGDIDQAFVALGEVLGNHADIVFGIALLASGISSSSVGTLAGQVVMQGYLRMHIPLFLRRAVTMAPAFIVIALGVNPSWALVISQVVLSFGIPFALIPLLMFCRDRELMGELVNHRITTLLATLVIAIIIALNGFLLWGTFTG